MEPSCPIFSLPYQIPTPKRCPPASLWLIILMLSAHRSLTVPCGSMSWLCQLCLEQEVYNSVGLSITGSVASICAWRRSFTAAISVRRKRDDYSHSNGPASHRGYSSFSDRLETRSQDNMEPWETSVSTLLVCSVTPPWIITLHYSVRVLLRRVDSMAIIMHITFHSIEPKWD